MVKGDPWCTVCCTRHAPGHDCPGNLLATGPERRGRKFAATHDNSLEYYGVLIAEAGKYWRARIFTYPNMLWSVPGARGTVKFVGATANEAETLAIEFLREHCEQRRYTMQDATEDPPAGQIEKENADRLSPQGGRDERHPCKIPIRFGVEKAAYAATTANLSTAGIYIATDKLLQKGKCLRMLLDVQAYRIPLVGTVAWVRRKEEPGKPKGMGVQLQHPPALYQRYVAEVQERMAQPVSGQTETVGKT